MSMPTRTFYASPTGGSSAPGTFEAPASLAHAITLASALLPAAPDSVWIVLRGGTYTQASTLAFTQAHNGLSLVPYPGEVPIIDGGVNVGTLVDDGSSQGVGKATLATITLDVWANGKRATRARSAQVSGWTTTAGGFTTSSGDGTTIGAFARKADLVVQWGASWRWGIQSISSVSGTTLTARAGGWALALSQQPIPPVAMWYENARELMGVGAGSAGYWYWNAGTSLLFYQPRSGETIGTASVIAGQLSQIITITGTSSTICTVNLRGIVVSHSSYTATQTSLDYASIQAGVGGNSGDTSGTGGVSDPSWAPVQLPAAVTAQYWSGTISGCTLNHHGTHAIWLSKGTQGASVIGNTIDDCGACGIVNGGALVSDETQVAADMVTGNHIADNKVTNWGQTFRDAVSILSTYSAGNTIEHNECSGGYIASMQIGWGWGSRTLSPATLVGNNTVRANYCHNDTQTVPGTTFNLQGIGSIYVNGSDGVVGMHSLVTRNYVSTGAVSDCFYADNGCGGVAGSVKRITFDSNVGVGAGLYVFNAANLPHATNCEGNNSFWNTAAEHNAGFDPSCSFSGNVNSVTGPTALAIIADAGTQ